MENKVKNFIKFLLLPVLLANILIATAYFEFEPDFLLHVNFYDVGQGDSIFIQTYLGNQILIDGGPSDAVLQHLGKDLPFWDRTIDMIVLTHAHSDHVSGLVSVLKRYKVKKVLLPDVTFHSGAYDEFLKLVATKDVEKIYAHQGQRVWLDSATVFDVYYPETGKVLGQNFHDGFSVQSSDLNDTSIVGKLSFGKNKFLFMGDAGFNVENLLLPQFDLDSNLLKVGHHGSKYSTSQELLNEVSPQYAVIEVGKNNYGHPTEDTLTRLGLAKSEIIRTDKNGTIRFVSDGTNLYLGAK